MAGTLDWQHRAFPSTLQPVAMDRVAELGWNLLAGDLLLPALVLKESALANNLDVMRRFCDEHGVELAPHGKTTMSPEIIERQLHAGAWAITAADVQQARAFRSFGLDRIVIANEVIQPTAVRWIADELAADESFECYSLVDSVEAVRCMEEALPDRPPARPLAVLVELGVPGGRAGARDQETAIATADAVAASRCLTLAGVEAYEGVLAAANLDETLQEVDRFLERLSQLASSLAHGGHFDELDEVLVTAGGSAFFDRVVEQLRALDLGRPTRVVLRSGCYVTHDSAFYRRLSPFGDRGAHELQPALEAWGVVLSRPEPDLAIVGFGKRDVPYDLDLPEPQKTRRRSGHVEPLAGATVTALNDQHAFVHLDGARLEVGDWIGCGISHPCTAFDKWSALPLVDDRYDVVGVARTYF
jgi:D-serine deaminase-like pyridoxal phosphate-dependent protein